MWMWMCVWECVCMCASACVHVHHVTGFLFSLYSKHNSWQRMTLRRQASWRSSLKLAPVLFHVSAALLFTMSKWYRAIPQNTFWRKNGKLHQSWLIFPRCTISLHAFSAHEGDYPSFLKARGSVNPALDPDNHRAHTVWTLTWYNRSILLVTNH